MKAGATEKLKFKRLRTVLGLPDWQLVGILESVWQATYHNSPAGDIGRLSNADIAAAIGWTDDADRLIEALTETGWLDRDATHRLLIHDWEEHCASWLKANFARHGKQFAQRTTEPTMQATKQLAEQPTVQLAEQGSAKLPPNQAKPNQANPRETTVSPARVGSFKKPTVAEVAAYCRERSNDIDAQEFLDHYEANGWKRGNTPIRDWKACVRTWEARRRKEQPPEPVSKFVTPEEYDRLCKSGELDAIINGTNGRAAR